MHDLIRLLIVLVTIVILSLASVPVILAEGAAFYKDFGVGRSRGTMPIQLAGNVRQGGLVERAFGLSLRQILEKYGGGTASGRPIRAVQVGGPLGAYFPASLLDTPIDYEAMAAQKGMLGHGGMVVFDDSLDHAAWNHADEPRVVIMGDLLRPLPAGARTANRVVQLALHRLTPRYQRSADLGGELYRALNG